MFAKKIAYLHIYCTIYGNICIRLIDYETDIGIGLGKAFEIKGHE